MSSGAALALEAAASGPAVTKLALLEPPFVLGGSLLPPEDLVERYNKTIAAGRRGNVIEFFMATVVGGDGLEVLLLARVDVVGWRGRVGRGEDLQLLQLPAHLPSRLFENDPVFLARVVDLFACPGQGLPPSERSIPTKV